MSSTNTNIEWTDATWSPVRGCSRVSEGCRNCYAEKQAARIISCERGRGVPAGEGAYDGLLAKGGQWNGQVKLVPDALEQPMRWKKPRRIFVNSMADLFHENVPFEFIAAVFGAMGAAPQHTFQILTKRPERMNEFFQWMSRQTEHKAAYISAVNHAEFISNEEKGSRNAERLSVETIAIVNFFRRELIKLGKFQYGKLNQTWPLPNVWLGVSVEDQKTADARIPMLLQVPAAVRWVSAEPLLGPINLNELTLPSSYNITPTTPAKINCLSLDDDDRYYQPPSKLDWVVLGGESGKEARPMHPDWARGLRDQCAAAGVPLFMKQLSGCNGKPIKDISLFPTDLQVREYPR